MYISKLLHGCERIIHLTCTTLVSLPALPEPRLVFLTGEPLFRPFGQPTFLFLGVWLVSLPEGGDCSLHVFLLVGFSVSTSDSPLCSGERDAERLLLLDLGLGVTLALDLLRLGLTASRSADSGRQRNMFQMKTRATCTSKLSLSELCFT